MQHNMTTTAFELDNYKTVRGLGIVRGIVVRSRSVVRSEERRVGKECRL